MPVRFAIFDCDGLLLDTERIYSVATQHILDRFGKTFSWELKAKMMGKRAPEAAALLVEELGIDLTPEQYLEEREKLHQEMFPECKPLPGALELCRKLKKAGIPIAVASSSFKDAFELKIRNNSELFDLFNTIVLGDDPAVKKGKPAPDIFEEAARRLGADIQVDRGSCLVFEDAQSGIEAAIAAKMPAIWVPDPHIAKLIDKVPSNVEVIGSLKEFNLEKYVH